MHINGTLIRISACKGRGQDLAQSNEGARAVELAAIPQFVPQHALYSLLGGNPLNLRSKTLIFAQYVIGFATIPKLPSPSQEAFPTRGPPR